MLELSKARKLALNYLKAQTLPNVVLSDPDRSAQPPGWVFFYQSDDFAQSGDLSDELAGNAPIFVDARTGEVLTLGTARPVEHYLEELAKSHSPSVAQEGSVIARKSLQRTTGNVDRRRTDRYQGSKAATSEGMTASVQAAVRAAEKRYLASQKDFERRFKQLERKYRLVEMALTRRVETTLESQIRKLEAELRRGARLGVTSAGSAKRTTRTRKATRKSSVAGSNSTRGGRRSTGRSATRKATAAARQSATAKRTQAKPSSAMSTTRAAQTAAAKRTAAVTTGSQQSTASRRTTAAQVVKKSATRARIASQAKKTSARRSTAQ
jgi:hypothetical protein